MIGFLNGKLLSHSNESDDSVILDVNGVGYELTCSLSTLAEIAGQEQVQLWVYTQMREDALTLFGFARQLEKRVFLSLLKVNGVGPKMAIKILSAARVDELARMIEAGDVKALSNLPKVGKKTAEQLILALKGKLSIEGGEIGRSGAKASTALTPKFTGTHAEILSALVNLGFRMVDAERVVEKLPETVDLQNGLRQGLQSLSAGF
jgi:Holliday junction DNA helicase RuvA